MGGCRSIAPVGFALNAMMGQGRPSRQTPGSPRPGCGWERRFSLAATHGTDCGPHRRLGRNCERKVNNANPLRRQRNGPARLVSLILIVLPLLGLPDPNGRYPVASAAEPWDVRVRLAWGGGSPEVWRGTIRVTEGTLSEVTPLGLEPDSAAAFLTRGTGTIQVEPRLPRTYDGCDLRIQAPADARLLVQLAAGPDGQATPLELPLNRLASEFLQFSLDNSGNRLFAQRAPGDALRVSVDRPSLVFQPSERVELDVRANHAGLAAGGSYVLTATLTAARTEHSAWTEQFEVRGEASGGAASIRLVVPLPDEEGAYDIKLALYPRRLTGPLVRGKPLATRKVQVVVVAPVEPVQAGAGHWQSVWQFDPSSPRWWERMARLPTLARLPVLPRPLENLPATIRTHLGQTWVELPPHAWHAYPLSGATPGLPHLVEVEYPSDVAQSLALRIVEPAADGQVTPLGPESGVEVLPPAVGHRPQVLRHRMIFWPQTRSPYLLLANRRDDRPAVFGRVDLQAGPERLPPLTLSPGGPAGRTLAAYYDKPLLAMQFSASQAVDPVSQRALDDWQTFLEAGQRLIQTLQHQGFNALVLTAACEGSSLYPSAVLQPTPKYDTGIFLESGQDPQRKDVLELLFRLCDRSGIVLVPAVDFSAPLPALEQLRHEENEPTAGLEPVGVDGRTYSQRRGGVVSGTLYNVLDPRVRQAMCDVVAELAQRYAHHASFGGVAVHLSADSFLLLPDESYSLDEATFERFVRDAGLAVSVQESKGPAQRAAFIHRHAEKAWLRWRAEQVASLVRQMRDEVTARRPGGKLVLTTSHLLSGHLAASALRPAMPPRDAMRDLLLRLGLDLGLVEDPAIVLPRPQRWEPTSAGLLYDQSRHWNLDARLDQLFLRSASAAALHFLAPAPQRLADFDAQSPFGTRSRTVLISQLTPSDASQRERFAQSLAAADLPWILDGGWMLPLGQEAALQPWVKVFRRLPAEPFTTPKRDGQPQELVVRTLTRGPRNWFYVLNPTPWPLNAEVAFTARGNPQLTPLGDGQAYTWQSRDGQWTWRASLGPYDLWAGEIVGTEVAVAGWSVQMPGEVGPSLSQQVRELTRRVHQLKANPRPLALANAHFDQAAADGSPSDWQTGRGAGLSATLEPRGGVSSPSCLRLVRRGGTMPLWVRSSPLPVPATGRLQVAAALRIPEGQEQPQLRLAVEGRWQGQVYYRRINVGRPERPEDPTPPELSTQWARFAISVTDLPLSGLSDLRVGFDLMSDGEVWIDDVVVFDLWLEEREYDELLKSASAARLQVETGRLHECRLFLESYWPALLRRHLPLEEPPAVTAVPLPPTSPPSPSRRLLPSLSARSRGSWLPPAEGPETRPRGAGSTAEADKSWLPSWLRWR